MTDDESFLQTILDTPGDEAPRLVYADWLDERNDPRGAYLRHEVFAFRLPDEEFPAAANLLQRWAATLDANWAARVSRPPVGVCVDHVRISEAGPALTAEEVDRAQERLGMDLSADYRAFLLNYNGGVPYPNHFLIADWGEEDDPAYAEAERFFTVYPPGRGAATEWLADLEQAARVLKGFAGNAIGDYLPIGSAESDNYLLLGVRGDVRGRVAYFADYTHNAEAAENIYPVAGSFAAFLALLADHDPEWVKSVWAHDLAGLVRWLDAGGDPNAVYDRAGTSALEMAVEDDQWEMAAELLRRGADLPRDLAKQIARRGPASLRQLARDRGSR